MRRSGSIIAPCIRSRAASMCSIFCRRAPRCRSLTTSGCIPHPRLGFYGVIDERLDAKLLASVADARPGMAFRPAGAGRENRSRVIAAPPEHPLSRRQDGTTNCRPMSATGAVALMPFALNESTRFISPTKTPNTWRRDGRSFPRRSSMWYATTAKCAAWRSPTFARGVHRRMRAARLRLAEQQGWREEADGCWRGQVGTASGHACRS